MHNKWSLVREDVEEDGTSVHLSQSKTPNGIRTVDLHPTVAEIMSRVASDTKPGARVCPYHLTSLRNRIRVPGFDSLRRFRDSQ